MDPPVVVAAGSLRQHVDGLCSLLHRRSVGIVEHQSKRLASGSDAQPFANVDSSGFPSSTDSARAESPDIRQSLLPQ
jgi:hypothetical protein